MRQPRR